MIRIVMGSFIRLWIDCVNAARKLDTSFIMIDENSPDLLLWKNDNGSFWRWENRWLRISIIILLPTNESETWLIKWNRFFNTKVITSMIHSQSNCSSCEPLPISWWTIFSSLSFKEKFDCWIFVSFPPEFIMVEMRELIIQNEKAFNNANRSDDTIENITISQ